MLKGSWRKEGQNYSKDVVVYSTLMDPVVTERASVEGYKAYIMKPVTLSTDLSDNKLEGLEANAIQVLIKNAQDEVKKESETIFGSEEDNSEEAKENRRVTKIVEKKKQVANDLWTMITTFIPMQKRNKKGAQHPRSTIGIRNHSKVFNTLSYKEILKDY